MAPRFSFVCKAMFAFFLSMYSVNTLSEERLDKAEQCVSIKSNINRLACFDRVFNTPVREQMMLVKTISQDSKLHWINPLNIIY